MRLTPSKLAQPKPVALTEFGHLLETFVVGELRKQASWLEGVYPPGHWRTHEGAEVDFVVERNDGTVIAIAVKSSSRIQPSDFRPLERLRDKLGPAFTAGAALSPSCCGCTCVRARGSNIRPLSHFAAFP